MSITIAVRFRPVDESGRGTEEVRQQAVERWTQELSRWPGVEGVRFGASSADPPLERQEALQHAGDVKPVDVQIDWTSREEADRFFGHSELVAELYGLVGAAPMTHQIGTPQYAPTNGQERP